MTARLPRPGGDNGNWGDILNDYLLQALKTDGTIKDNAVTNSAIAPNAVDATIIKDGSITEANLDAAVQIKLNATAGTPDWSTIMNKPAVIAAGVDATAAKAALSLVKSDVGLGNVDNTSDATKNSATATLTNKTLINPSVEYFLNRYSGAVSLKVDTTGGSDVNYVSVQAAPSGSAAAISSSSGTDTNVDLNLKGQGSGVVKANGVEVSSISGTQTLTNKTIDGGSNTITNATGTLAPCHVSTYGGETFTIVGGTVTQIAGTTVGQNGYAAAIGDRILILNAPASTGVGSSYTNTTQPANGIYVVKANTTNLTLARSKDMSSSNPMFQTAWVAAFGGWGEKNLYQVTTPSTNAAFTWGTDPVVFSTIYGNVSAVSGFSLAISGFATLTALSATRITRRTTTITQSATPTINTDNTDVATIVGLAQPITSMTANLTGTPVAGDTLTIQITDNGTSRAITWGAKFEASTTPLPTTTTASTLLTVQFLWNTVTSKWCVQSANGTDTLVYHSSIDTLINKAITARVTSITSSATPMINTDNCDAVTITALATPITSMTTNLSGTPNDFQQLMIRIKDNGIAQNITWDASFGSNGVATLPTTTVAGKTIQVGLEYNSAASKWICIAVDATGY